MRARAMTGRQPLDDTGTRLAYLTIQEARHLLDSGEVSAREITDAALARIDTLHGSIEAFDYISRDVARAAADDFDRRRAGGHVPLSAVDGIPMSLKDVLITLG